MKWIHHVTVAVALIGLLSSVSLHAETDAGALRAQFDGIIEGLNENSFDRFNRAISKSDMTTRIFGARLIEPDVKQAFSADFSGGLQEFFTSSFPQSETEIRGTLVDFKFSGSEGRAVVRYASSGYRYSYHVYELGLGPKGKLRIIDWVDYYQGSRFSDEAGQALVMALPSRTATRSLLVNKKLGDGEIFQVGELLKAVRDNKSKRFFQIFDDLSPALLQEPVILRLNLRLALASPQSARAENAVRLLTEAAPDQPLNSLRLLEYYIPARRYEEAIDALERLQAGLGVQDGATESLMSAAALAMGNAADAEDFALKATAAEPSLEVGWWSLLRARTRGGDYAAAIEPLARLEDDFGHNLDAAKLKRDRFLGVLADTPEYQDWRASRN